MQKIILLFLSLLKVKCDLPVHCIAKEIAGEWEFFIMPEQSEI